MSLTHLREVALAEHSRIVTDSLRHAAILPHGVKITFLDPPLWSCDYCGSAVENLRCSSCGAPKRLSKVDAEIWWTYTGKLPDPTQSEQR